ncbi:Bax inhibitor-1/YccA family protein, partial [Candidatus Phytoplasma sp. AldY-WA1]|uniref:Bax inhibitor-1/YccA family protein n=1 Tax=Candidatus Phytoplasma sp. AldY-WA1 TaxID=2852100 RepID=UPI002550CBF1
FIFLGKYFFLLFWIPFLTTFFLISSVTFLYYFKKICLSEKKVNLVITISFFFHLINIAFSFYIYWVSFDNLNLIVLIEMVIGIVLAILGIVLGTLMWIVTLQQLDEMIEQKIPCKYQWLVISALFVWAATIFVDISYIVLVIIKKMMNIDKK